MSAYLVDDDCLSRVAYASEIVLGVTRSKLQRQARVAMLYDMNNRALRARYGDAESRRDPDTFDGKRPKATLKELREACRCYLYQCSEGKVPELPLFGLVETTLKILGAPKE